MLWILVRIPVGHVPIRGEAMSNWNSFDVFSKVEIHPVDSPELLSPQTLPASFKIKGFIHNSVNYSSIWFIYQRLLLLSFWLHSASWNPLQLMVILIWWAWKCRMKCFGSVFCSGLKELHLCFGFQPSYVRSGKVVLIFLISGLAKDNGDNLITKQTESMGWN